MSELEDGATSWLFASQQDPALSRQFSRSPHPYHRRSTSLTQQDALDFAAQGLQEDTSESSTERGTEADDEKGPILKSLPAPPLRARKGLRGSRTPLDLTPGISPLPSPPGEDGRLSYFTAGERMARGDGTQVKSVAAYDLEIYKKYTARRRAEIARRCTEFGLLACICSLAVRNAAEQLNGHITEPVAALGLVAILYGSYPVRLSIRGLRQGLRPYTATRLGFRIPSRFDPGPLLYPVFVPFLVSASLHERDATSISVNLVLGLASIPASVIPCSAYASSSQLHWLLSVWPLWAASQASYGNTDVNSHRPTIANASEFLGPEIISLLFPLHQTLLAAITFLTTTSLDPAEIHLLSVGLINLLLFATSPQAQILKAALWLGGLSFFVLCRWAMSLEISLARVPAWKFTRNKAPKGGLLGKIERTLAFLLPNHRYQRTLRPESDDEDYEYLRSARRRQRPNVDDKTAGVEHFLSEDETQLQLGSSVKQEGPTNLPEVNSAIRSTKTSASLSRALSSATRPSRRLIGSPRSGLLALTFAQAQAVKWLLAVYVYSAIVLIFFLGIRTYVARKALNFHEPFGWAIGYLFGNISSFRLWTVSNNLERWISLPVRPNRSDFSHNDVWLETARQLDIGPANTRLLISAYCAVVLVLGLKIVSTLNSVVEVDTRRKVFHGMMVAMLLPTIYIDPCFISLALMVILAAFLLLDLFRASQLPPISKPLTSFLAPYVDGRDHRGPVVVSHIFLLIGCAIPLWLTMAGFSRSGEDPWTGWEVQARDVSMVSGVVCVGMGDAAASLIGRRYGKTKWFWGGGKSLEGSFAFAAAVVVGLMTSYFWLRLGGWVDYDLADVPQATFKAVLAASGASILESVLTAANDNVVVPIGLWLLIRGLHM